MTNVSKIGNVEIRRVVEWVGPIRTVDVILPDTPADVWSSNEHWLAPDFHTPTDNSFRAAIQTWVLHVEGQTIVVDTGVGNNRDRPHVPPFSHLKTDFLERLDRAGVDRDDVDIVINTHIHYDHVGWNTMQIDGSWVPTFPNARYLVPDRDRSYFRPENADRMRAPETADEQARFEGIRLVYADSIIPIDDAGQLETWDGELTLGNALRLELAPGHTPGSSVLWLESGDGAAFVGDLIHTPMQLLRPDDACSFDLDKNQARLSRRDVLSRAARLGATVLPAHYAGRGGVKIRPTTTDGYTVADWATFDRI